jgi:hypothetical protein
VINPFHDVNWNPGTEDRRKFARSLVVGFPCLSVALLLLGWALSGEWNRNYPLAVWLTGVGAGAGIVLWLLPAIAKPFYLAWYFLACCMGIVMSNLLLGGFYYLMVTPFGLVRRWFNPKGFPKGFDRSTATYWQEVTPTKDPGRYYKQF